MQGFYFCPAACEPRASVYSGFCHVHANYTTSATKAFTGLYSGVSIDLTNSSAHNTADTQAAYTPPAPRRSAYRQAQRLHRYQIPPPRRTLYRSGQPPYYNKVYKGARVRHVIDPCPAVHHSADHVSSSTAGRPGAPAALVLYQTHARQLKIWHRVSSQGAPGQPGALHPVGQSSNRGETRRAEPLAAAAASLFGLSPDSQ